MDSLLLVSVVAVSARSLEYVARGLIVVLQRVVLPELLLALIPEDKELASTGNQDGIMHSLFVALGALETNVRHMYLLLMPGTG